MFNFLRKKIWMNDIKAVTTLSPALEEKILGYEPYRISQLAKIAKMHTCNERNERAFFRTNLKILVKNPVLIDRSINAGKHIQDFLDNLFQDHANSIVVKIKNNLSDKMPDECSIQESIIQKKVVELLLSGKHEDKIYFQLNLDIQKNPSKFIQGYHDWLSNFSKNIFDHVHEKLQEKLPNGCSINLTAFYIDWEEVFDILKHKKNVNIFDINTDFHVNNIP